MVFLISVIFFTAIAQSVFGIGLLAFGTPILLISGYDFITTLSILLPCSLLISSIQVYEYRKELSSLNISVYFVLIPFTCLGFFIFVTFLSDIQIKPVIGTIMLLSAALRIWPVAAEKLRHVLGKSQVISLGVIGVVHGLSNMGGSLLTVFCSSINHNKVHIRTSVAFGYLLMAAIQLTYGIASSQFEFSARVLMLPLVGFVGYYLVGKYLFEMTLNRQYSALVTSFIAVMGLMSIAL